MSIVISNVLQFTNGIDSIICGQSLLLQIQVTHAATYAEQTQKAAGMVQQSVTWQPSCILRF